MTKAETVVILSILKAAYPKFYEKMTKADAMTTLDLWTEMFEDVDVETVKLAVKSLVAHLKFPPTIADVREEIVKITTPDTRTLTADDAWGEVVQAIRKYGYYREEEALKNMNPITARLTKRLGWRELCMSENQMADRAHFLKMFEAQKKTTMEVAQIPAPVRERIENMTKLIGG